MKVKTVLFDLDGTLINTIPLIRWTMQKVFRELELPWGEGEVMQAVGLPLWEIAARYAPEKAEEFVDRYTAVQQARHRELTAVYPGTLETLEAVRAAGCRTGVVTSKRRQPALDGMAFTGIDRHIEVIVAAEDVARTKPDPEPFTRALALLGALPESAVCIGDSWYDIQAGKQAGLTTIGVTWGMATRTQLLDYAPDFVIDSWAEFLAILRGLRVPGCKSGSGQAR